MQGRRQEACDIATVWEARLPLGPVLPVTHSPFPDLPRVSGGVGEGEYCPPGNSWGKAEVSARQRGPKVQPPPAT